MLEEIKEKISKPLSDAGYSVYSINLEKEGEDDKIVINIDNEEGITIEDCVKATKVIKPIVDEINPLNGEYLLEVGSKGISEDGE